MASEIPPLEQLELAATGSGRRIAFSQFGDPLGTPLIYAHGFPSSRREAWLVHAAACEVGARIISIDRPGYGDSEPAPERRLSDWPEDVLCVADQLGLECFGLIGVSGGGPYVLACAWRLAQAEAHGLQGRLTACVLVCPLGAIYRNEQLEQMHWAARMNLRIGQQAEWLSGLVFGGPTTTLLEHLPSLVENTRSLAAPAADRQVLADPETAAILNRTIADAMRNGAPGARRDLYLYGISICIRTTGASRSNRSTSQSTSGTAKPTAPYRSSTRAGTPNNSPTPTSPSCRMRVIIRSRFATAAKSSVSCSRLPVETTAVSSKGGLCFRRGSRQCDPRSQPASHR